jgi:Ca2+:H+ antiporter
MKFILALFVTPFLVLVGWISDIDMSMDFEIFETAALFASIFVVNALIEDGKTHWLEGWMLLASYCIIALGFYFYK